MQLSNTGFSLQWLVGHLLRSITHIYTHPHLCHSYIVVTLQVKKKVDYAWNRTRNALKATYGVLIPRNEARSIRMTKLHKIRRAASEAEARLEQDDADVVVNEESNTDEESGGSKADSSSDNSSSDSSSSDESA